MGSDQKGYFRGYKVTGKLRMALNDYAITLDQMTKEEAFLREILKLGPDQLPAKRYSVASQLLDAIVSEKGMLAQRFASSLLDDVPEG